MDGRVSLDALPQAATELIFDVHDAVRGRVIHGVTLTNDSRSGAHLLDPENTPFVRTCAYRCTVFCPLFFQSLL